MKTAYFTIIVCLLTAVSALSQERPRLFDNFDTLGGVQVYNPTFVPVGAKRKLSFTSKSSANKKFVQPTAQVRPVKQPAVTKMAVSEGLADRERPATSSFNNNFKLPAGSAASLKGFTTGDPLVDSYIVDSSRRYGIDPLLIYSQMHQESTFKARAVSYKGASGLMQLMPATARRLGVSNIFDPKENIDGGVRYMRMLMDMFGGDVSLALAGYNAGEGAVMKYGNQIPPYSETQEYVRRISARYASISDGTFAHSYRRVTSAEAAKLEKKGARPLTVYEPNAVAIRLADGRMRLVNQ